MVTNSTLPVASFLTFLPSPVFLAIITSSSLNCDLLFCVLYILRTNNFRGAGRGSGDFLLGDVEVPCFCQFLFKHLVVCGLFLGLFLCPEMCRPVQQVVYGFSFFYLLFFLTLRMSYNVLFMSEVHKWLVSPSLLLFYCTVILSFFYFNLIFCKSS